MATLWASPFQTHPASSQPCAEVGRWVASQPIGWSFWPWISEMRSWKTTATRPVLRLDTQWCFYGWWQWCVWAKCFRGKSYIWYRLWVKLAGKWMFIPPVFGTNAGFDSSPYWRFHCTVKSSDCGNQTEVSCQFRHRDGPVATTCSWGVLTEAAQAVPFVSHMLLNDAICLECDVASDAWILLFVRRLDVFGRNIWAPFLPQAGKRFGGLVVGFHGGRDSFFFFLHEMSIAALGTTANARVLKLQFIGLYMGHC